MTGTPSQTLSGSAYDNDLRGDIASLTACIPAATEARWPLWSARILLYAALLAVAVYARILSGSPQGRETMIMAGLALLFSVILFLTWAHEAVVRGGRVPRTRFVRDAATFGASCVAVGRFLGGTQADAVHALSRETAHPRVLWPAEHADPRPAIHEDHVGHLPRFSATLSGRAQAPVSMVFLGTGAELLRTFQSAGWHVADRVTPRTALRAFACGVLNKPYPSAPVLPVFVEGRLHSLAFQRHDEGDSSRRRHHARWWHTDLVCEGRPVWVATASFDAGVGVGRLFPLPIHHIDPDIDAEREYIVRSLTGTGSVEVTQRVQITEPMTGKNAAGDRFFTDGVAAVLA